MKGWLDAGVVAAAAVVLGGTPASSGPQSSSHRPIWVERESYQMGTLLRIRVVAQDRPSGLAAIERAFREVERGEALLSSWRADSRLSRLNAAPVGEVVALGPAVSGWLDEAARWARSTGGAFDPAVGALVSAWDLRGSGRRPGPQERVRALASTGLRGIRLDIVRHTGVRLAAGAWLDAGGFGKGAALREAARALRSAGVHAALLDFGGQIMALGAPQGTRGWSIGVAHPAKRNQSVAALRLRDRSAATTGASERYVVIDGSRVGHVLDPRTGRPVPAWGSVTVVAADPLEADALSTALFVLGPESGLEWATRREGVEALFLIRHPQGIRARWTPGLDTMLIGKPGDMPSGAESEKQPTARRRPWPRDSTKRSLGQ